MRPSERDDLDFKFEINQTKKGQADLIKDVGAISNSGGGAIFFGVKAQELIGVPGAATTFYDPSRIDGYLKKHLSPVPTVSTEFVKHNSKIFPLLKIAASEYFPVVVSTNLTDEENKELLRAGTIYIRQNTMTVPVTDVQKMHRLLDGAIAFRLHTVMDVIQRADALKSPKKLTADEIFSEGISLGSVHK